MDNIYTDYSYAIRPFLNTYTKDKTDLKKRYMQDTEYDYFFNYFYNLTGIILDEDDIINIVENGIK